ncbi:hypothetical protein EJ06DRAFT_163842 [Trichodelitschia bisporula]|uniref:Uncharacterized protein n=1 Tax=Trichodelitschia bisporula TaxID=703511 RepID=A0A6G1HM66_9PEZI|nr:hypothetical protein EJ06DRAFT_163842 [Trichodelitschia bisporula]
MAGQLSAAGVTGPASVPLDPGGLLLRLASLSAPGQPASLSALAPRSAPFLRMGLRAARGSPLRCDAACHPHAWTRTRIGWK